MDDKKKVKISKYLSKHLRHQPERLELILEDGSWVEVDKLLKRCAINNFPITEDELNYVVEHNDKKRFSFSEDGKKIRANQGHSVEVDLKLEPTHPPDILFHGTGQNSLASVLETGLLKMARHHVHLSADIETALKVGSRHGKPIILKIDTNAMLKKGFEFYVSANGVWLVESVPPEFLEVL